VISHVNKGVFTNGLQTHRHVRYATPHGVVGHAGMHLATDVEALTSFGDVRRPLDFAGQTRRNLPKIQPSSSTRTHLFFRTFSAICNFIYKNDIFYIEICHFYVFDF
jgi:hypothetical protein